MKKTSTIKKSVMSEKPNFTDIPETTAEFWVEAEVRMPAEKTAISIRLDNDIIKFFKKKGKGYQSRINAVLRTYIKHTA